MLRVKIEKIASTMITNVIAVTTDVVVRADRLSVLGRTFSPKWQAIKAINAPNTNPLPIPIHRLDSGTTRGNASMKNP